MKVIAMIQLSNEVMIICLIFILPVFKINTLFVLTLFYLISTLNGPDTEL